MLQAPSLLNDISSAFPTISLYPLQGVLHYYALTRKSEFITASHFGIPISAQLKTEILGLIAGVVFHQSIL
jgi:hypothetical protein